MRENPDGTPLSVLHISTADNWGGSGRSAYRIHTGLRRLGWRSRLLVGMKVTDDPDVDHVATRPLRALDRVCGAATERLSLQYLFYPSSFVLPRHTWFRESDVVQLYNTHGGYFSHTALPRLSRLRPIVWRLSDMWPLSGHCSYSYDCTRWKTGCGACPIVSDPPRLRRDTTHLLWRVKRAVYSRSDLNIVAPSRWIARVAAESPLLQRFPIHVIPNGLDTDLFRPIPKESARDVLGLPREGKVLLLSAQFLADRRKGAAIADEALGRLRVSGSSHLTLLVVGAGADEWRPEMKLPLRRVEHVNDDRVMAAAYAASDVFLFPTLAENLPNGVIESMACGTPAVAFDVGGCAEAVRHMETGYLAKYRDVADFVAGIELLLGDRDLCARLGATARQVAEAEYNLMLQARRYADLYCAIVERAGARQVRLKADTTASALGTGPFEGGG